MSKGTVNKVILVGYIGRDPEVRFTADGMAIANFSLATTETKKDKTDITEWHRVVVFSKLADIVGKYAKKGSKVYVEGKIQTKKWIDKNTNLERSAIEILADSIQLLDRKSGDDAIDNTEQAPVVSAAAQDFFNDDIHF